MEKSFKTPTQASTKKQKRFINPLFLDDVSGKGICVVRSKELAGESLKTNKLQRHMETHENIVVMSEEARKRVFHYCYENLTKSQAVLSRALSQKRKD